MTNDYQDFQHLDNEDNDYQLRQVPPASQPLFRRLCSGPCLLRLSLGLGLLLLVVVCVIGSQRGSVGRKLKSLESQLEKQQQDLSEDHSGLLLHVKQFVSDLRSLSCQMAVLYRNGTARACCPVNWLEYEGSCYWFSRSGKSWAEADRYCQLESAHLVVVGSWEEQKFVQHHMGPVNTWMGLTDQSGLWKWVDGTDYETGFKNWRPEQPDDWYGHGLGGGEDCAHFTEDGRWNDDVCQRPYRWVCETAREPAS
ncbi:asialoglycoprotein receptor 1 isoform X6 [Eumetopias jubatus]|uniref:Asialoglycoprotein receptor 1-like isoform X7 n=1 Tax=Callorhinus ursinus TaxID=34884 RepID=A0A3Q7NH82_CALUR|nr:asialoglycoprotein receptor 1-like isoform X7 [Callorhinus ursinus]XP_027980843.1 asialoglycoprotein receptor 1 isoform X6 [Eumetopias jubatus]